MSASTSSTSSSSSSTSFSLPVVGQGWGPTSAPSQFQGIVVSSVDVARLVNAQRAQANRTRRSTRPIALRMWPTGMRRALHVASVATALGACARVAPSSAVVGGRACDTSRFWRFAPPALSHLQQGRRRRVLGCRLSAAAQAETVHTLALQPAARRAPLPDAADRRARSALCEAARVRSSAQTRFGGALCCRRRFDPRRVRTANHQRAGGFKSWANQKGGPKPWFQQDKDKRVAAASYVNSRRNCIGVATKKSR